MKIKNKKIEFCCEESEKHPFGLDKRNYENILQYVEVFDDDGFIQNEGTRIEQTIKYCPFCGVATTIDKEIERGI